MSGQWQPNQLRPPDLELELIFQLASVSQRQAKLVALAKEVAAIGKVVNLFSDKLPGEVAHVLIDLGAQAKEALKGTLT